MSGAMCVLWSVLNDVFSAVMILQFKIPGKLCYFAHFGVGLFVVSTAVWWRVDTSLVCVCAVDKIIWVVLAWLRDGDVGETVAST